MTRFSKPTLRADMLQRLSLLNQEAFILAGAQIAGYLQPSFSGQAAIFKNFSNEIDTSLLLRSFSQILLPTQNPELYAQRILEADIKLVLVPGLAFDRAKNRLGRGKGYYDRCLGLLREARNPPLIIGLCMDCQLLEALPIEAHDQPVDKVLTPLREIP